jgi:hypothetical protein
LVKTTPNPRATKKSKGELEPALPFGDIVGDVVGGDEAVPVAVLLLILEMRVRGNAGLAFSGVCSQP